MTKTLSTFFALLALACLAATAAVVVTAVVARLRGTDAPWRDRGAEVGDAALWLAWVVAATTTAGSLYYSLGAHFEPCELCWYQRICVYPLSVVLLVAALRRDRRVWMTAVPLAVIGVVISTYHTQLQAFPEQTSFCSLSNPCTTRYVWEFGFVSLPLMALSAFLFIITMTLVAARCAAPDRPDEELPT